jgi:hypothetical protein
VYNRYAYYNFSPIEIFYSNWMRTYIARVGIIILFICIYIFIHCVYKKNSNICSLVNSFIYIYKPTMRIYARHIIVYTPMIKMYIAIFAADSSVCSLFDIIWVGIAVDTRWKKIIFDICHRTTPADDRLCTRYYN